MQSLKSQIGELNSEINLMKKDNDETMTQIHEDTETEIKEIQ